MLLSIALVTLLMHSYLIFSSLFQDLSAKYQKSPAQLFYLFLNNLGIIPLSGTQDIQHMRDDVQVLGAAAQPWHFSADEMNKMKESIAVHG